MTSYGTILVQVFTSRAQIPIQGATVAFTQKAADGRHRLLAARVTDQSGRTTPLEISTPDSSVGLSPGHGTPFALLDLWVQAPGYELFQAEDVQIFPGTQTVQEVSLLPLPEFAPPDTVGESVHITPQNL